jgi:hypothetical protein
MDTIIDNINQYVYLYNDSGNIYQHFEKNWSGTAWQDYYRFTVTFTGSEMDHELTELYNKSSWTNSHQINFNLQDGHYLGWIEQVWEASAWLNEQRITLAYGTGVGDHVTSPDVAGIRVYPNPFNPSSTVEYNLSQPGNAIVQVFNARGQLVKTLWNGYHPADVYQVTWNGSTDTGTPASSGVYVMRMMSGGKAFIQKTMLLKWERIRLPPTRYFGQAITVCPFFGDTVTPSPALPLHSGGMRSSVISK